MYRPAGSDSESDGYVNAKKNIPSRKERQRQLLIAEGRLPPSQAEVRFSARRSAQVTNYNEDGEDSFEESENDMTPHHWAAVEEDTGPIIDKILDHRPKEGAGKTTTTLSVRTLMSVPEFDPFHVNKLDFEYLVSVPIALRADHCSNCG